MAAEQLQVASGVLINDIMVAALNLKGQTLSWWLPVTVATAAVTAAADQCAQRSRELRKSPL